MYRNLISVNPNVFFFVLRRFEAAMWLADSLDNLSSKGGFIKTDGELFVRVQNP